MSEEPVRYSDMGRALYERLARRMRTRTERLDAALIEANESGNYTRVDELRADLNEEADHDLDDALNLIGRLLRVVES